MTTPRHIGPRGTRRGFTLVELIGVLAIIAIMASILAPNALRSLDRAAVRAEYESVARIGSQFDRYVREQIKLNPAAPNTWLPATASWATAVGTYSDFAIPDLQSNKRRSARLLVYDTSSPQPYPRALLLSSMRVGLNLPGAAAISANFQTIWQTEDTLIPSTLNWTGWSAVANSGDYLVVQRINFRTAYLEDGQTYTVTLNNTGATPASYRRNGASPVPVNANSTTSLTLLRTGDRIDLYAAPGGSNLNYSYVVSTRGRAIDFDGTQWKPN